AMQFEQVVPDAPADAAAPQDTTKAARPPAEHKHAAPTDAPPVPAPANPPPAATADEGAPTTGGGEVVRLARFRKNSERGTDDGGCRRKMKPRIEPDTFGPIDVAADRYWGAQTERSRRNFRIGDERMPMPLIQAFATVKQASADVNKDLGSLDARRARAIG